MKSTGFYPTIPASFFSQHFPQTVWLICEPPGGCANIQLKCARGHEIAGITITLF